MGKNQPVRISSPGHGAGTDEQNPSGDSRNSPTNTVSIRANMEDLSSRTFRFLDLPQELRNEIYEYDLRNCDHIRLVKKGRIVSNSNLHLVSRQVNNELAALLINTARASYGKLYYPVTDFEFKPAMFAALRWLVTDTSVTTLDVRLSITKTWSSYPSLDSLPKWYKWIDSNAKHNKALEIKYTIGSVQDAARAESFLGDLTSYEPSRQPPHALLYMIWSFLTWYANTVIEKDTRRGAYTFRERMQGIERAMERAGVVLEDRTSREPEKTAQQKMKEVEDETNRLIEEEREEVRKYCVADVGMAL